MFLMLSPPHPSVRSVFTDVPGSSIHALVIDRKIGEHAPTFVLVPGLGLSGRYMMPTAELLAESGTVWIPDLPGCGKSARPKVIPGIPELADALIVWMDECGIKAPILVGNSLGAQVIVDLCARYPAHASRAVLVAPTIDPKARRVSRQILRLLVDGLHEPKLLYWIAFTDYLRAGFGRMLQTLRLALADPVESKLSSLSCPVLIIRGGLDPIVPQDWAEHAFSLIEDAELVVIPHAAHAVNFNSPSALVAEILRFGWVEA
jgi:2-hydroxy-6-oxonona-2,4-dienedioate hydrolase